MKEGRYKEAIEYLNKAIDKNATNADAFNMRGVAYFELKEYQNALMDYDQAIRIRPGDYRTYLNRALLTNAQNQPDKSLQDYNEAIRLAPDTADLYLNRGQILAGLDSLNAAIRDFERATQLSPKHAQAWYNLGNTYFRQQNFKESILCFQKTTRIAPDFGKAYYGLALAQQKTGESELSCLNLKQAVQLGYQEAAPALDLYCRTTVNE